jgi:hypothetical protein
MNVMTCLVSIAGDPMNKVPMSDVTVPEIQLLQRIHGDAAVTEIRAVGNPRTAQLDERERLVKKYPKHARLVMDLWRDNGGKFLTDIRDLKLIPAMMGNDRDVQYEAADRMEEKAAAEAAAATVDGAEDEVP